jgi:uncharacterized membrane protein YedE/YeeE
MNRPLVVASFLAGLLFALGLAISGMTQPAKVIGFLDLTGDWDPSLTCVMAGAIGVHALLSRLIRQRPAPLFAAAFSLPTRSDINANLVGGAALFGLGWGISGFCPGPAVTSLASGRAAATIFVVSMLAGMYLYKLIEGSQAYHAQTMPQHTASPLPSPATPVFHSPQDY